MIINNTTIKRLIRESLESYQLSDYLELLPSDIHGTGVFATVLIPSGTDLGVSHILKDNGRYNITTLGKLHNHSYTPNCENRMENDIRRIITIDDISPGEEITVDYTKQKDLEQPHATWK